ncbi:histidine kinase [Iodobacter sp. HSC-16F04]|uniref:Histidine kinase n=1 Tax=Iodobacter violaceini TaxID=3044271 RepID=A0ABX0KYK4_9NEIS|nr:histidine kinase [Iodobacter violacea]NHQ87104.1 histidine kinase [Iodobacter violacea]
MNRMLLEQSTEEPVPIPDFRNFGVMLRILLLIHLGMLAYVLLGLSAWEEWPLRLGEAAMWAEPPLLGTLLVLSVVMPWLNRFSYRTGTLAVSALAMLLVFGQRKVLFSVLQPATALLPALLFTMMLVVSVMLYLRLRWKSLSPRLTEARLAALQARIRPHFFFNSLNAVLSLIRSEPRRAEQVLEDLADLFRVVMVDKQQLSTVECELEVARRYLNIEAVRLGDRLKVEWDIAPSSLMAALPPLLLQPLLENAIYYGVEPILDPGPVMISIAEKDKHIHLGIKNSLPPAGTVSQHKGNGMALQNIRQRLLLHFDAEANLSTYANNDYYQVHIVLPYREIPHGNATAPFSC